MTEIPAFGWPPWAKPKPTRSRSASFSAEERWGLLTPCSRQTHTHTQQNTSLNWERLLVIFTRGLVDRLPERVNRRFPGACNTSHGSSGTRRSATGEEQRERREEAECWGSSFKVLVWQFVPFTAGSLNSCNFPSSSSWLSSRLSFHRLVVNTKTNEHTESMINQGQCCPQG